MEKENFKIVFVDGLGECTLLPLAILPEGKSSYKNLLESAKLLGLQEIPTEFLRKNLEAVSDAAANMIGVNDSLWVSGTVKSCCVYDASADPGDEPEQEEDCVTWVEYYVLDLGKVTTTVMHVSIEKFFLPEHVHCLFLGKLN